MSYILIVEDTVSNAQLLRNILEAQGYQVQCAYNGADGLAQARQACPDLIIIDLRLSGSSLSGWDLIQRLREDDVCRRVPIIVAAVEAHPLDRVRAFEAGCDRYLTKPFKVQQLRDAVAELVGLPG